MEMMIIVMVIITALLTVVAGSAWATISFQIKTLNDRIKDYYLITPDKQMAQGVISEKLFNAMKDICETAKAHAKAEKQYHLLRNSNTAVASEAAKAWDCCYDFERALATAVERLIEIDEPHEIVKR